MLSYDIGDQDFQFFHAYFPREMIDDEPSCAIGHFIPIIASQKADNSDGKFGRRIGNVETIT